MRPYLGLNVTKLDVTTHEYDPALEDLDAAARRWAVEYVAGTDDA